MSLLRTLLPLLVITLGLSVNAPLALAGPAPAGTVLADLDGDGDSDFVLRNFNIGQVAFWIVEWSGTVPLIQGGSGFPGVGANFEVRAVGKFNSDNIDDLVILDLNTFDVFIWYMGIDPGTGSVIIASSSLVGNSGGYMPVGVGQFNPASDSEPDILLRDPTNGDVAIWYVVNGVFGSGGFVGSPGTADWIAVAAADLDGDGVSDIILRNSMISEIAFWELDSGSTGVVRGSGFTLAANFAVLGLADDLDGDGIDDIVFYDPSTNQIFAWIMFADAVTTPTIASGFLIGVTGSDVPVALGQFNPSVDSFPDLVLFDPATNVGVWTLNAGAFLGGGFVGLIGTDWFVAIAGEQIAD